ncbi:hypothetical protein [Brevundimonas sp.]|jgi:hypothetical protein|uniref:hypothetical protein n=1 Tax=Brevundimonas sp. TaxID=1871086 RepID=UPI0037C19921
MADGFDIHLNEDQARRLKAAAEAAGVDPTAYALELLDLGTQDDWAEDERRFAEYERTGEFISLEEFLRPFEELLAEKKRSA